MIIEESIHIEATPSKVWSVLTESSYTKQYMFGCALETDWNIGSKVDWVGVDEKGQAICFVTGEVKSYSPHDEIHMTTFDPNAGWPDIPANHVDFKYQLSVSENGTTLTVIQGDFSRAIEGAKRYEESKQGWKDMVLPMIKNLAEAN